MSVASPRRPERRVRWSWLLAPAITLGFAIILVTSPSVVAVRDLNDLFVTFDAMWRAASGQRPHIDFPSPLGQAFYWPFSLASGIEGFGPRVLLWANAGVGLLVCGLASALLWRRMPPLLFTIAVLTGAFEAMSPRGHDGGAFAISWVAPYNLWCWGILTPLSLTAVLAPKGPRSPILDAVDGVMLGVLAAALLYIKVTFFAGAVAALAVGVVFRTLPLRTLIVAGATLAFAVGLVEVGFHNNLAYLGDLRDAAAVNSTEGVRSRVTMFAGHLAVAGVTLAFFAATAWVWLGRPRLTRETVAMTLPALAATAFVLGQGVVIATQNHPEWLNPSRFIALLAGATFIAALAPSAPVAPRRRWEPVFAAACIAAVSVAPVAADASTIAYHRILTRSALPVAALGPENATLRLPAMLHTRAPKGVTGWRRMVSRDLALVREGATLLRRHDPSRQAILAMDFSDPYPMVFRAPPPRNAQIWWDPGRNLSWNSRPTPQRLLCPADLVMRRRDGYPRAETLWAMYGPAIARDFRMVDRSANWDLWARQQPCAPAGNGVYGK